jgi:putative transcriptional regulator
MMEREYGKLGALIIEGLQQAIAYERGELTNVRVHRVEVTARKAHAEKPPYYPPLMIREVRQKLGVSQAIFAEMLGVSASTVRAWEQGKREPEGPARRVLQLADCHPEVLKELSPIYPGFKSARSRTQTLKAAAPPPEPKERLAADTRSSRRGKS